MSIISKPHTFSPSTTAESSEVNANFDTLYNDYNGGIAAANLATGAVTTAKIADDAVTVDKIADSAVGNAQVASGVAVQAVSSLYSAVATGTTTIPLDDSIPQNTEGTEFMTCSITPKSTTNLLVITVNLYVSLSVTSADIIAALFQDTTANALSAIESYIGAISSPEPLTMVYTMTAGTTSSTTFKVRVGGNSASTVTFNGASGSRRFGAIPKSAIVITEYKA